MIDRTLQAFLFIITFAFLIYIISMVRSKKLELRYSLTWLFAAAGLMILTLMPNTVKGISDILHIKETVNTLFLIIIFFLILIIFSLTRELSKNYLKVSNLIQDMGCLKLEVDSLRNEINKRK